MTEKDRLFIHTSQPSKEMWERIEAFRSPFFCEQFLAKRIENDFHGLNYKELFRVKNSHVTGGLELEDLRILNSHDMKGKAIELSYDVRQAKEYYVAAQDTTEVTLPVLLYYGMVSLGKMLVDSTFKCISVSNTHGLAPDGIKKVSVKRQGFFTRFHDTYNSDPTIYVRNLTFAIKELLSIIPEVRREYEESYGEQSIIKSKFDEEAKMDECFILKKDGLNLVFPALTSHFLLMFRLSSLARYKPKEWGKMIEGRGSAEIYPIRKFLKASARRFPNLIINKLFGKTCIYYPVARLG